MKDKIILNNNYNFIIIKVYHFEQYIYIYIYKGLELRGVSRRRSDLGLFMLCPGARFRKEVK